MNIYPVTADNAIFWIVVMPLVICGFILSAILFVERVKSMFVPKGYKHDKELDAMIRAPKKETETAYGFECEGDLCDCASLAHPADKYAKNQWMAFDYVYKNTAEKKATTKAKKATPKNKPVKYYGRIIPEGWKKHTGKRMPALKGAYVLIMLRDGWVSREPVLARFLQWVWFDMHLDGDIIAYKEHDKKDTKKPAKKVTMRKKNGKLPKVSKK